MTAPIPRETVSWSEPGRLWSLWEMLRFHAAAFAAAMSLLSRATVAVHSANQFGLPPDNENGSGRRVILDALAEAAPELKELPLSRVLEAQFERLCKTAETCSEPVLAALMVEYHNNLMVELSSAWFLMIPAAGREYYQQRQPPFGEAVRKAFPEACLDINAASRCFALDEWTACVFHLMRALEHSLRTIAAEVGLHADVMAHENWKTVIDQIEKKIREMEILPKSPEKIARLKTLSEAAVQFAL